MDSGVPFPRSFCSLYVLPQKEISVCVLGFSRGGWGLQVLGGGGGQKKWRGQGAGRTGKWRGPYSPVPLLLALVQLSVVVGQG